MEGGSWPATLLMISATDVRREPSAVYSCRSMSQVRTDCFREACRVAVSRPGVLFNQEPVACGECISACGRLPCHRIRGVTPTCPELTVQSKPGTGSEGIHARTHVLEIMNGSKLREITFNEACMPACIRTMLFGFAHSRYTATGYRGANRVMLVCHGHARAKHD